jgi:hypothetical protein
MLTISQVRSLRMHPNHIQNLEAEMDNGGGAMFEPLWEIAGVGDEYERGGVCGPPGGRKYRMTPKRVNLV